MGRQSANEIMRTGNRMVPATGVAVLPEQDFMTVTRMPKAWAFQRSGKRKRRADGDSVQATAEA